jgi:sn-glycerol 3-phosphate transport system permease protein
MTMGIFRPSGTTRHGLVILKLQTLLRDPKRFAQSMFDASLNRQKRSFAPRTAALERVRRHRPLHGSIVAYLLLLPSLFALALFTYTPVVQVVWDSLHVRADGTRDLVFNATKNYTQILSDKAFLRSLTNTLAYALGTLAPSLVLALGFALVLSTSSRATALLRAMFFMPVLIPLVAASSLFLFIFLPNVGLLDHYLGRFFTENPNWLGNPDLALWSIVLVTVWKNSGYYMLFFLAGLQAIPADAYEAAHLDGANTWQRLRYVTLPYLKPTLSFVTVIALLNTVTQVDHVFVLTKGGPSDSTNMLLFYIYQQAVESYDIGRASAATVLSLGLLLALTLVSFGTLERSFGGRAR